MRRALWLVALGLSLLACSDGDSSPGTSAAGTGGAGSQGAAAGAQQQGGSAGAGNSSGKGGGGGTAGDGGAASSGGGAGSAPEGPTEGEACLSDEGTVVCGTAENTPDGKGVLYCKEGVYKKVFACPGGLKCGNTQGYSAIRCGKGPADPAYSLEGALCGAQGSSTCSFDESVVLSCEKGVWTTAIHCPPSSCAQKTNEKTGDPYIACANDGYSVGDQCSFTAGTVACSTDLTKILGCADGKTVVVQECGGKKCVRMLKDNGSAISCE